MRVYPGWVFLDGWMDGYEAMVDGFYSLSDGVGLVGLFAGWMENVFLTSSIYRIGFILIYIYIYDDTLRGVVGYL